MRVGHCLRPRRSLLVDRVLAQQLRPYDGLRRSRQRPGPLFPKTCCYLFHELRRQHAARRDASLVEGRTNIHASQIPGLDAQRPRLVAISNPDAEAAVFLIEFVRNDTRGAVVLGLLWRGRARLRLRRAVGRRLLMRQRREFHACWVIWAA